MQPRFRFILYISVIIMLITIIIHCVYERRKIKPPIDSAIKTEYNNEIVNNTKKIEIETDKEVDTQAIEPVKDEPIFYLTDYERWVVECVVMGESGGEPYEGQVLVAQCMLNACLKDNIQPSEAKINYKYSGWKENPTRSVKRAVSAVFDLGEKIVDEPILYFYAPSLCKSKWHETQIFIIECGGHRFFKEKVL